MSLIRFQRAFKHLAADKDKGQATRPVQLNTTPEPSVGLSNSTPHQSQGGGSTGTVLQNPNLLFPSGIPWFSWNKCSSLKANSSPHLLPSPQIFLGNPAQHMCLARQSS